MMDKIRESFQNFIEHLKFPYRHLVFLGATVLITGLALAFLVDNSLEKAQEGQFDNYWQAHVPEIQRKATPLLRRDSKLDYSRLEKEILVNQNYSYFAIFNSNADPIYHSESSINALITLKQSEKNASLKDWNLLKENAVFLKRRIGDTGKPYIISRKNSHFKVFFPVRGDFGIKYIMLSGKVHHGAYVKRLQSSIYFITFLLSLLVFIAAYLSFKNIPVYLQRPINAMINFIDNGRYHPVLYPCDDEIGELTNVFNENMQKIVEMFKAQQSSANASDAELPNELEVESLEDNTQDDIEIIARQEVVLQSEELDVSDLKKHEQSEDKTLVALHSELYAKKLPGFRQIEFAAYPKLPLSQSNTFFTFASNFRINYFSYIYFDDVDAHSFIARNRIQERIYASSWKDVDDFGQDVWASIKDYEKYNPGVLIIAVDKKTGIAQIAKSGTFSLYSIEDIAKKQRIGEDDFTSVCPGFEDFSLNSPLLVVSPDMLEGLDMVESEFFGNILNEIEFTGTSKDYAKSMLSRISSYSEVFQNNNSICGLMGIFRKK